MESTTSGTSLVGPLRTVQRSAAAVGADRLHRRLGALALIAVLAAHIAGCATHPEVVRENRWALEHPKAFVQ